MENIVNNETVKTNQEINNSEQIIDSCGEVALMFSVWQPSVSYWFQLGKIPKQPYFFKYYTPTTTKRERTDDTSSVM